MRNSFTLRLLIATAPLVLLMATCTLSEIFKKQHGKRTIKRISAGALKGLAQGPNMRI